MMRFLVFLTVLLIFSVAYAADPKPYPLMIVGKDIASSSSQCIGKPSTPECAVDTLEASTTWADGNLLHTIMDKDLSAANLREPQENILLYKELDRVVLEKHDVPLFSPKYFEFGDVSKWKEGDNIIFTVEWRCSPNAACKQQFKDLAADKMPLNCPPTECGSPQFQNGDYYVYGYILRQMKPDKWNVVDAFTPANEIYLNLTGNAHVK